MRKWIIAGTVVLVLAVAAIAALLNVNYFVTRNRGYLIEQAEQALGRKISVSDVQATILTGLGVRLTNFAMSDDPAYSSEDFIRASDLQMNVKFWPLLRKEVQLKRIILHEPIIRIIRNPQGNYNFSSIAESQRKKKGELEKKSRESRPAGTDQLAIVAALVNISDGEIRYIDRKHGGQLEARQIDLKVEDFHPDRPFSIELAAALYAEKQNLVLRSKVGPLSGSEDLMQIPLEGVIDIDPLDLSRLNQALPALRNSGSNDVQVSGIFRLKNAKFKGSLANLAFDGETEGFNGVLRYGESFQKPAGIPLVLSAAGRYAGDKLSISKGRLKLHTLELATTGDIQFRGGTVLNISVNSQPASLEGWERIIPALARYQLTGTMAMRANVRGKLGNGAMPHIEGSVDLTNASARPPEFPKPIENLDTQIHFSGPKADIREMSLSLGKSRIRLSAAIEKFAPLTLRYKMSTPEIWPADYNINLGENRKADVIRGLQSEGRITVGGDKIFYDGQLSSAEGTLYGLAYKGLDTALAVAEKVAAVRQLRVDILKGSLQMEGEFSFREPTPRFAATSKVRGVDIAELYSFLDSKAEHDIRGRMNADMKLAGSGETWEAIKPTLRGQGTTEVVQGALLNFNIAEQTLGGITGIPGLTNIVSPTLRKKYPETFTAKDTEFNELRADFELGEGRVNVNGLRVSAAEFIVHGNGWVDFNRRIEFPANLVFSQRLSADLTQAAREVKYLLNKQGQLEIPMNLSGRLPNVKPRPDLKFLGQVVQRGFVQKGVEELENRFFGRNRPSGSEEAAPDQNKQKKRNSTEDVIRRGLESLFKR